MSLYKVLTSDYVYRKQKHRIHTILKYYTFYVSTPREFRILKKYFGNNIRCKYKKNSCITHSNKKTSILNQYIYNKINHFILSLGEFCNNYCSYCFYNKTDSFPTDKQVNNFLTVLSRLLTIHGITIMGGEPTLYTNLQYIIKTIVNMNKHVLLLTSNMYYENIYNINVLYHIVKYVQKNKIILMNNETMSFDEFKQFTILKKEELGITQGVITQENYDYVFELEPYIEFRIQTDRKGSYMLTEEQISKLPKSILEREIKFYIQEVINNNWITYNLAKDVFYNNADR